jgi:hypothetical protein
VNVDPFSVFPASQRTSSNLLGRTRTRTRARARGTPILSTASSLTNRLRRPRPPRRRTLPAARLGRRTQTSQRICGSYPRTTMLPLLVLFVPLNPFQLPRLRTLITNPFSSPARLSCQLYQRLPALQLLCLPHLFIHHAQPTHHQPLFLASHLRLPSLLDRQTIR